MLGYELSDQEEMVTCLLNIKRTCPSEYLNGLEMAIDFLQGLWAEGYFD